MAREDEDEQGGTEGMEPTPVELDGDTFEVLERIAAATERTATAIEGLSAQMEDLAAKLEELA